jgi:hypothetical protein
MEGGKRRMVLTIGKGGKIIAGNEGFGEEFDGGTKKGYKYGNLIKKGPNKGQIRTLNPWQLYVKNHMTEAKMENPTASMQTIFKQLSYGYHLQGHPVEGLGGRRRRY